MLIKNKKTLFYIVLILLFLMFFVSLFFIVRYNRSRQSETRLVEDDVDLEIGALEDETRSLLWPEEECDICSEDMLRGVRLREELEEEYPWLFDLPIETEEYIVVWILEKKQFRIDLKIPESSTVSRINNAVEKAVSDIENLTGYEILEMDYYVRYIN